MCGCWPKPFRPSCSARECSPLKVIVHCPLASDTVPELSRRKPLVLLPFLGGTVLAHALTALAGEGIQQVGIEAGDRTPDILQWVGNGKAWGLRIGTAESLQEESPGTDYRELTLDQLPQLPGRKLWVSYLGWFDVQMSLLESLARLKVGMREIQPGVFVGLRSRVAADARLSAPLWIGEHVFVGSGVRLGPKAIIEDHCYIDAGTEVSGSVVGPETYVGSCTEIHRSFAWGGDLLNFESGSFTQVADKFLLGPAPSSAFSLGKIWSRWRGKIASI